MKRLILALATLGIIIAGTSVPALAAPYNPFGNIDCTDAPNTAVCQDANSTDNPITGPKGVVMKVANILAILAGIAAVIVIVVAGFMYVTSAGDAKATGQAKNAIIFALVGVAVIVFARTIIAFVISKT
jgi:hypothetical protein